MYRFVSRKQLQFAVLAFASILMLYNPMTSFASTPSTSAQGPIVTTIVAGTPSEKVVSAVAQGVSPLGLGPGALLASAQDTQDSFVAGGRVYWPIIDFHGGPIDSVPVGGGSVSTVTVSSGLVTAIFVSHGFLYYANNVTSTSWDIVKVPVSGGSATVLATIPEIVGGIAVAGSKVFFSGSDQISRVSTAGGAVKSVTTDSGYPWTLVASSGEILLVGH